jgi:Na+/H+ antiporter NhaA
MLANVTRCVCCASFVNDNHKANKRNLKNLLRAILFYFILQLLKHANYIVSVQYVKSDPKPLSYL